MLNQYQNLAASPIIHVNAAYENGPVSALIDAVRLAISENCTVILTQADGQVHTIQPGLILGDLVREMMSNPIYKYRMPS